MMLRRLRTLLAVVVATLVVTGCARGEEARPRPPVQAPTTEAGAGETATQEPSTTAAPEAPAATTTAPASTVPRAARVAPAPAQSAAASCPAVPSRVEPRADRPSYQMRVDVRPAEGLVAGRQTVRFTPDVATDRVVFRLWANAPRIVSGGGGIEVFPEGDVPVERPNPTTLVLKTPVAAGQTVTIGLVWNLTLPTEVTNDRISRSGNTVRLGSFFPVLAWHPGVGWATEPATAGFAESSLSLPADFDVNLTVPEGLEVLATGVSDQPGHWVASGVPDWAVSVGDFKLATGTADGGGGSTVAVTVGVDRQVGDAPGPYLDKSIAVLADFSRRFGPYPWPSYSLAITPRLSGGIEYPMHVMQGPGTLGRTTSHEVAHMWFYGLVASNQGANPWIDEGLATYAEARYEKSLEEVKTKAIPAEGKGRAGEPMTFWESRLSVYYRSVYVQGAQAVAALGPPDLVDCALRQLVARQAYRIAGNGEVVAAFTTVFPDAASVLARYGIRA